MILFVLFRKNLLGFSDDPKFEEIPDIDDEDALDDPDETISDEIEEDEKQEFSDEYLGERREESQDIDRDNQKL